MNLKKLTAIALSASLLATSCVSTTSAKTTNEKSSNSVSTVTKSKSNKKFSTGAKVGIGIVGLIGVTVIGGLIYRQINIKQIELTKELNELTKELFAAIYANSPERVEAIIKKGADVNATDECGRTALARAAEKGHTEIVKLLLDHGAHANTASGGIGCTALMLAAGKGHTEVVELLLNKGADVDAINNCGRTALMEASREGHTEVVELLRNKGADVASTPEIK